MRFIDKAYIIHHMPFFTVIAWAIVCGLSYIIYPSGSDQVALMRAGISMLVALPVALMLCFYNVHQKIKKHTMTPEYKVRRMALTLITKLKTPHCWDDLVDLANCMNENGYDFLKSMNALVMYTCMMSPANKMLPEAISWKVNNQESYNNFVKRAF